MKTETKIKIALLSFIVLLILSGITAFPIESEMQFLMEHRSIFPLGLANWIQKVYASVKQTPDIVFYGTDWLAFAHIIIALFFIPVYRKPIQYRVNLQIGMCACLSTFPVIFICGPIRNIPFLHQCIDCLFEIFGLVFLIYINKQIKKMAYENK